MSKQEFTLPINSVEHLNIAKNYLNNFSLSNHNYHKYDKFDGNDNNIYAAVIVEPRCHELLETVIRNVCYFLNQHPKLDEKDKDAFMIMGLEFNADWATIQKKFKTLVKKFHPDKNLGNRKYEDKLKKITLAYSHLKMFILAK